YTTGLDDSRRSSSTNLTGVIDEHDRVRVAMRDEERRGIGPDEVQRRRRRIAVGAVVAVERHRSRDRGVRALESRMELRIVRRERCRCGEVPSGGAPSDDED